jgi:hypothetical protein
MRVHDGWDVDATHRSIEEGLGRQGCDTLYAVETDGIAGHEKL